MQYTSIYLYKQAGYVFIFFFFFYSHTNIFYLELLQM